MYCTVDDVKADFKNLQISTSSSVTIDEVTELIKQETAFIDTRICALYTTPVIEANSPTSYQVLKKICIFLSSDRLRHILYVKTGNDSTEQDAKGLKSLTRNPIKMLDSILNGKIKLGDAVPVSECIGFDVSSDAADCNERQFDVNKQQW